MRGLVGAPRALDIAVMILVAAATGFGLWKSATNPSQRQAVETLEVVAANRGGRANLSLRAPPEDLAAARAFCDGSLTRHLSRLEQDAPAKARAYGLIGAQLRFGPARPWQGLVVADANLSLEGGQASLAQALTEASAWAPGLFFDEVRLTPAANGALARLDAKARVVCRAP